MLKGEKAFKRSTFAGAKKTKTKNSSEVRKKERKGLQMADTDLYLDLY